DVFLYDYDVGVGGMGADEARVEGGDSGGPTFAIGAGGALGLVGIHWFNYDPSDGQLGGSGDTFVPSFIDEVNAAMALAGSSERLSVITAVPEPSTAALLLVGIAAVGLRRSRISHSIGRSTNGGFRTGG